MLLCVAPGLETVNCRCAPFQNTLYTLVFAAGFGGVTAAALLGVVARENLRVTLVCTRRNIW